MTTISPTVLPLGGHLGAEVRGASIDQLLGDDDLQARLRGALLEHAVVVLPGLAPDHDQHIALARVFGEVELPEPYIRTVEGHPEICDLDSDGGYKADRWHADVMWKPVIPLGAVLCMRQRPDRGGDTVWASTAAAYDALSEPMKRYLDGVTAHNDIAPDMCSDHPAVTTHPETGRKALFVSELFTRRLNGVPAAESDAILAYLFQHIARPEFSYRHHWADGDVVIWDNRTTQHYAVNDYTTRRVVQRVGIRGTAPAA